MVVVAAVSGSAEGASAMAVRAVATGEAQLAISDDFLSVLTAVGSEDDVRAGVQRYLDAGATSPCVGPIPTTSFEATLQAAAPGG